MSSQLEQRVAAFLHVITNLKKRAKDV